MTVIVSNSYGTTLHLATTANVYYPDPPPDIEPPASGDEILPVYLYANVHMSGSEPFFSFVDRAQVVVQLINADNGDTLYSFDSGVLHKPANPFLSLTYYFPPQGPGPLGVAGPLPWENLIAGDYGWTGEYWIWSSVDGETRPAIVTDTLVGVENFTVSPNMISPGPFWPPFSATAKNGPKTLNFVRSKK